MQQGRNPPGSQSAGQAGEGPLLEELPAPGPVPTVDAPLPSDPRTVLLAGIFLLALFAALYAAAELVLPLVLAILLKLLLQPACRLLEKLGLPRSLAALLLILGLASAIVAIGAALVGPAAAWADKLPASLPRLEERLSFLSEPINAVRRFLSYAEGLGNGETAPAQTAEEAGEGLGLSKLLIEGMRDFLSGLLTTLLLLFFLLLAGDTFLRRLVEVLPRFHDKRQAVDLSLRIERDISLYLVTITAMNAIVGLSTGIVMWACGVGNPLLWGVVSFLLNYVPVLGPIFATLLFVLVGLLTIDVLWQAFLPAMLYFLIHVIEGELVTPLLLARRFTLNPALVIVSLIFWYWMWGVPGAILAVPMLAVTKLVCDRIRPLAAFGHFLSG